VDAESTTIIGEFDFSETVGGIGDWPDWTIMKEEVLGETEIKIKYME
jgi:hypothetical protein